LSVFAKPITTAVDQAGKDGFRKGLNPSYGLDLLAVGKAR